MVVGVGDDGLAALNASTKVKLDNVACALLVEKERPIVDHEPCAIDTMWEFVGGGRPSCDEVFFRRILSQSICAIWCPRHVVDLIGGLKRVFAPGSRLMVRLEEVLALVHPA